MRISAKAEYACVAMLELAVNYGRAEPLRIREIADAQNISGRFLVQILLQLKTAGLVASVRGASGGYQLARPPEQITLAEIVYAIDDRTVALSSKLAKAEHRTPITEVLLGIWDEMQTSIQSAIQAIEQKTMQRLTLAELLRRIQPSDALVYQI